MFTKPGESKDNSASGASTSSAPVASRSRRGKDGEFIRGKTAFRDSIKADKSSKFPAARGRYHLFVSYACPWANRTLIMRKLKGLEDVIAFTVVDWFLDSTKGWEFNAEKDGCEVEPFYGFDTMKKIYLKADPNYQGSITVPVLWDTVNETIVNNESEEIIRMLNSEFNEFCATDDQRALDFYPEAKRDAIDKINADVYPHLNNGVYRCGFATTQKAYDIAVNELFTCLDGLEQILDKQRYLIGDELTEADIRLFVTLIRFDVVYVCHFKCNKARIEDYPNLRNYVRDLYQRPEFKDTVDFVHIKNHYYMSHRGVNPNAIVPLGPEVDFTTNHDRDAKFS